MNIKRNVAIISRESNSRTLDVLLLEEELKKRGIGVTTLSKLLTKDAGIKSIAYIGQAIRQELAILGAKVVVLDTYCIPASIIPHRKTTKIIQMWHALGAIKKFGEQTVGMSGGASKRIAQIMKMHKGYDYVTAASDITAEHFCEAFRCDRDKIVKKGLPRIDYIKAVSCGDMKDAKRAEIVTEYPALNAGGKKTVLYAPTFRKGAPVNVNSLIEAIDKEKYNVVVKLHPLYRNNAEIVEADAVITDDKFSSYDWLSTADIIISDYSSLVIEATLADKPIYIYAYDLDEYTQNTGLNVDYSKEPIAPYVYTDAKKLTDEMSRDYEMDLLRSFRERYIEVDTGNCTTDLADFIEGLL